MTATTTSKASWDPVWEEVFREQEWGKYPPEYAIRFVARNWYKVAERKAVKLLDLGCGPGACTWYMAREGFSVSAIDGSPTAIDRLVKRLAVENLQAEAVVGSYENLPWADATFDGVVDNVSLCCNRFAMCKQTVAEVARTLKPGGRFCSANFTPRTWGYGSGDPVEPNAFTNIREGPLAGKGFNLFMSREQVDELYAPFREVEIEKVSYTVGGMAHLIELWVVNCRKE